MKVGVCDDSKADRSRLVAYCKEFAKNAGINISIKEYSSGEEMLGSDDELDILFLDIEMNNIDGIDVMKKLERARRVWKIVFVNSHKEYIFDIFGLRTLGFIEKPIGYEKVGHWLDVACAELCENNVINVKVSEGEKCFYANEIVFVEALKNYTKIYTDAGNEIINYSLKSMEETLGDKTFVRVHKSYIVNMEHIEKIKDVVTLKSKSNIEIPVGRTFLKTVKEKYAGFIKVKVERRMSR